MFRNFLIILALLMSVSAFATNKDYCVEKSFTYGEECGSSDSMMMKLVNRCNREVYIKYCLLKKNGKWSCGVTNLGVDKKWMGAWTCHSKNWKYKFTACTPDHKGCAKLK